MTASLARFDLVWNWPEESRPDWLRMSSPSWEEEHASTALHRACFVGHEVLVRLLLHHHGANVVESAASHALIMASTLTVVRTAVGNEGHTVLMLACACHNGHEVVARLLLDHGADVEAVCVQQRKHSADVGMRQRSRGGGETSSA